VTTTGKSVLVTGGTFGIGLAITLNLAARGHRVVGFGREAPQVSSIAQDSILGLRDELSKRGRGAQLMEADVSQASGRARPALAVRLASPPTRPRLMPQDETATGDDIANVVVFLLSPEAETLSGTVIDVGCFSQQGGPVPAKPTMAGQFFRIEARTRT
jgi:nucleoside-diphosphate-sugar epimerase